LVFCAVVTNIKPLQCVHFTICVGFICVLLPKGFSTDRLISVWQGEFARVMGAIDEEQSKPRSKLTDLAVRYFKKEGYKVNRENAVMEGYSGESRHFDLIVQKGRVEQGVWIRDWKRTVGVNLIINIDTASEDVGLGSPIMIADKFSDHAKSYSNRRKITLLTKQKMGSFM